MTQNSLLTGTHRIPIVSSGAHAALRGYRRQFLYALYRIVCATDEEASFHLEHLEDIEVLDGDGQLLEAIQVKDYSSDLVYSNLIDHTEARSFLKRALKIIAAFPNARVVLSSYGEIGTELSRGWAVSDSQERQTIQRKLLRDGFSPEDCTTIFTSVAIERIEESAIIEEVNVWLTQSALGGDPEYAFRLLYSWLYGASEQSLRLTFTDLQETVNSVGRYLQERATHHQNWFTTIKPLDASTSVVANRELLATEFYEGVGATYNHILAGVDVIREAHLNNLVQAFNESRIVILRGASGQGKSALAYRFIYDCLDPRCWAYEVVQLDDYSHAQSVVAALAGHLKVVRARMYLYIDVRPGSVYWTEVVRGLLTIPNVFVLITIREEDYRKLRESKADLGNPKTVSLSFDQSEAEEIYSSLSELVPSPNFLSFQEAWTRFGGGSALLEFVHLVTKQESLRDRLERQIAHLQELTNNEQLPADALHLLRRVALASAYGARITMRRAALGLNLPEPLQIIHQFEGEYQLIRRTEEGQFLEGLHPIRSAILIDLLTDEDFHLWSEIAVQSLASIPEADLEPFLLHCFLRGGTDRQRLLEALETLQPETWMGVGGVTRALLWLGIDEYVDRNHELIAEVMERSSSVFLQLDTDFCGYLAQTGTVEWWQLDSIPQANRMVIEDIRARQSPKNEVFDRVKAWLLRFSIKPRQPEMISEWLGLGEVAFWIGYLEITPPAFDEFDVLELTAVNTLPLEELSTVAYGLSFLPYHRIQNWLEEQRSNWLWRFQNELMVPYIEDNGETIRIHFIVDLDMHSPDDRGADQVLSQTMLSLDMLQKLIPNRDFYASKGYGHEIVSQAMGSDSSIKRIPNNLFFPQWSVNVSSIFIGRAEYPHRFENWKMYADAILHLRESMAEVLRMIRRALSYYFQDGQPPNLWARHISAETWSDTTKVINRTVLLPKSALDPFGFISEGQNKRRRIQMKMSATQASLLALGEIEPCRTVIRKITTSLANFLRQAEPWLATSNRVARDASLDSREAFIQQTMNLLGDTLSYRGSLPTTNLADALGSLAQLQAEYRKRFSLYVSEEQLSELESREWKQFLGTFGLWHSFVYQPTERYGNPQEDSYRSTVRFQTSLLTKLITQVENTAEHLYSVRFVSDATFWEGKPALWFTIDVEDASLYPQVTLDLIESIRATLQEINIQPFGNYLSETFFSTILVIPLVRGQALSPETYAYNTAILVAGHVEPTFSWLDSALQYVPAETWQQLNVPLWQSKKIDVAKLLVRSVYQCFELWLHGKGLEDLTQIPDVSKIILDEHQARIEERIRQSYAETSTYAQKMREMTETLSEENTEALVGTVRQIDSVLEALNSCLEQNHFGQMEMAIQDVNGMCISWVNEVVAELATHR